MKSQDSRLVNIWEDTVDLRELLIGLALGGALGIVFYLGSLRLLSARLVDVTPSLVKAYALMGGIIGTVVAALIVGRLFKPKRILGEAAQASTDRLELLRAFGADPDEEAKALSAASPKMLREMQQLQIHDLFEQYAGRSDKAR